MNFAGDIWKARTANALAGAANEEAQSYAEMAGSAVPYFDAGRISRLQGTLDAQSRGYTSSRGSGLNWAGAALSGVGALAGSFKGFGGSSKLGGYGVKDNTFGYKPTGIDFSSGWS